MPREVDLLISAIHLPSLAIDLSPRFCYDKKSLKERLQ